MVSTVVAATLVVVGGVRLRNMPTLLFYDASSAWAFLLLPLLLLYS